MCGIHLITGEARVGEASIDEMVRCSEHRGPDANATYQSDGVALGFNRLEIVGGGNGEQPILSEDQSLVLVANGEVFNHAELRKKSSGHTYRTASDVEVLLHLYEEFGTHFIRDVEGQFSFVIFDKRRNKVIFARDRWGITPLFYAIEDGQLVISSSIRSLIKSGGIQNVSLDALGLAESWTFYGPTPPRTYFKSICQLSPGCYAEFSLSTRTLICKSYVSFREKPSLAREDSLANILETSVRRRLQGNHGPGVYVSGGLDSSVIAAIVNKVSPRKPTLFSIAFTDSEFDESSFQQLLAESLECKLQTVRIGMDDIVSNLETCVSYTEGPLVRAAPVPMMLLSAKVKAEGIKYVLCGEGADELFAGYPVFTKGKSSVADKWEESVTYSSCFIDSHIHEALELEARKFLEVESNLQVLRQQEIDTKLSRYLLVSQGDRTAMANSVEQRFPFLDSAVRSVAFSLDKKQLTNEGGGKQVLREAFRELLPNSLIERKKQGYLAPDLKVAKYLRDRGTFQKVLSRSMCDHVGIFNFDKIDGLVNNLEVETQARFLLFAYTTHVLFENFIGRMSNS